MKLVRSLSALALCAAGWAAPLGASATTVSAGQTMLFNVDISAFAPTLEEVVFRTNLAGFDGSQDSGIWSFFSDANAQGATGLVGSAALVEGLLSDAGFLDGIFSITLRMDFGAIDIEPEVFGKVSTGGGEFAFTPSVSLRGALLAPPTGVPEPGSLVLVLAALGGTLVSMRRHKR